jgi:hypothetical protein
MRRVCNKIKEGFIERAMLDMILRFKCKPKTEEGAYVKTYLKDH